MPRMQADERRSTIARAFAVLDIVAASSTGAMSLTEIASLAGLPTPTTHRYLRDLLEWGGVERTEDGFYRLGLHVWQLGTRARWDRAVRQMSIPALEQVTRTTGFGACVVSSTGRKVVTVERRWGADKSLWINPVGNEIPLPVSTAGLLSIARTDATIEDYLHGLPRRRAASAEQVVHAARTKGYAIGVGLMRKDQGALSVPVPGEFASELALTLIFPTGRTQPEDHIGQLKLSAAALSIAIQRGLNGVPGTSESASRSSG